MSGRRELGSGVENRFEFDGFAGQIERESRAHGELQGALQGAIGESAQELSGIGRGVEIRSQIGGEKNPAAAIETGREVIDLQKRRGHAASIGNAPDECVEIGVQRTGGPTAIVKVGGAEANDGAERFFPGECREIEGNIGIRSEDGAGRAGRGLVLIDQQRRE